VLQGRHATLTHVKATRTPTDNVIWSISIKWSR